MYAPQMEPLSDRLLIKPFEEEPVSDPSPAPTTAAAAAAQTAAATAAQQHRSSSNSSSCYCNFHALSKQPHVAPQQGFVVPVCECVSSAGHPCVHPCVL